MVESSEAEPSSESKSNIQQQQQQPPNGKPKTTTPADNVTTNTNSEMNGTGKAVVKETVNGHVSDDKAEDKEEQPETTKVDDKDHKNAAPLPPNSTVTKSNKENDSTIKSGEGDVNKSQQNGDIKPSTETSKEGPASTTKTTASKGRVTPSPGVMSLLCRLQDAQVALTSVAKSKIQETNSNVTTSSSPASSLPLAQKELLKASASLVNVLEEDARVMEQSIPKRRQGTCIEKDAQEKENEQNNNDNQEKDATPDKNIDSSKTKTVAKPSTLATTLSKATPMETKQAKDSSSTPPAVQVDKSQEKTAEKEGESQAQGKTTVDAGEENPIGNTDAHKSTEADKTSEKCSIDDNSSTSSPTIIEEEEHLMSYEDLSDYDYGDLPPHIRPPMNYMFSSADYESPQAPASKPPSHIHVYDMNNQAKSQPEAKQEIKQAATSIQQVSTSAKQGTNLQNSKVATNVSHHQQTSQQKPKYNASHPNTSYYASHSQAQSHYPPHHQGAAPYYYPQQSHDPNRRPSQPHPHSYSANPNNRYYPPARNHGHPYPPVPAAAVKPIRRLAKIRPYANQVMPVSKEEIRHAIPKDASSVFHIMDRRVNWDAFDVEGSSNKEINAPIYSMLRAWVQDDPYRQIPPSQPNLSRIDVAPETTRKRERDNPSNTRISSKHSVKKQKVAMDLAGFLARRPVVTVGIESLRKELVKEAKETKEGKSKKYKEQMAKTLRSLRKRGIV